MSGWFRPVPYFGRARLEQDVSCITAAGMVIRRAVFDQVGGFDEQLAVAYNDVDLSIRIRAAGWRITWTPTAIIISSRHRRGCRSEQR
jgi:O-antigen biosynthesis protein